MPLQIYNDSAKKWSCQDRFWWSLLINLLYFCYDMHRTLNLSFLKFLTGRVFKIFLWLKKIQNRCMVYCVKCTDCLLINLPYSLKAELQRAQLNGISRMHMKKQRMCLMKKIFFPFIVSVFFKFLSSWSFVKRRRLWVHLLDIFIDSWSNESSRRNLAEKAANFAGCLLLYTTLIVMTHLCKIYYKFDTLNVNTRLKDKTKRFVSTVVIIYSWLK